MRILEINENAKSPLFVNVHPVIGQKECFYLFKVMTRIRVKEMHEFEAYIVRMKAFIQFCLLFNQIDVTDYINQLNHLEMLGDNKNNLILNNVCKTINFDSIKSTCKLILNCNQKPSFPNYIIIKLS